MFRRKSVVVLVPILLVVGALHLPSWSQETGRTIVRVKGANSMASTVDKWGAAYGEKNPDVRVVVSGGGTEAGFEALFENLAEVVMASRKVTEKEIQTATVAGVKLAEQVVGNDCIAIITHVDNPVPFLTMSQLKGILTGAVTNWKQVGGLDEPLVLITSPHVAGTAMFLRAHVMEDAHFGPESLARLHYHDIIREIAAKKPTAIGYAGMMDAKRGADKRRIRIIPLKKDDRSAAVLPSDGTLKDGSYPLIQPLFFYWNGTSPGRDVQKFIDYCTAAK